MVILTCLIFLTGCRPQVQRRDTRRRDRGVRVGLDAAHHRPGQPVAYRPGREMRAAQHWRSGDIERGLIRIALSCIILHIFHLPFQIIAINGISLVGLPLSTCQNYIKVRICLRDSGPLLHREFNLRLRNFTLDPLFLRNDEKMNGYLSSRPLFNERVVFAHIHAH